MFGWFLRKRQAVPSGYRRLDAAALAVRFSIPAKQADELAEVYLALLNKDESIPLVRVIRSAGRDLFAVTNAAIQQFGLERNAAARVARWLGNLASVQSSNDRRLKLGITECVWRVSTCGGTASAPNQSHRALDGKRYFIAVGLEVEGGYEFPGVAPGCTCIAKPVIPALED